VGGVGSKGVTDEADPVTITATPSASLAQPRSRRPRVERSGLLATRSLKVVGLAVSVCALTAVVLLSCSIGPKPISFGAVLDALFRYDEFSNDHLIVRSLRVPRTIVGLMVGVALGLAGAVMQGVARNPLADPGILGVEAGASLFVVIAINSFGIASVFGYVWFAFVGAALASVIGYGLGSLGREGATPVKLALAGSAITAVFASITSAILLIDVETLDQFRFWSVGSLAGRNGTVASHLAPFFVVGTVMALVLGRVLNALALGDDVARSLGQKVGSARLFSAATVVLLVGAATAAAGPIAFVGLTVPHAARAIVGPDYRWVLPYSAVLAPTLLLGSDVIGRVVARPDELQVGIVTALVGSPFFVVLVRRRKLAEL
jgi:iron complex transport system permease protein